MWESDGTNLGERFLFRYDEKLRFKSCQIEDDIYFIMTEIFGNKKQFFQVSLAGEVLDRSDELKSIKGRGSVSCLDEHILFDSRGSGDSSSPILFSPKTGAMAKVLNSTRADSWTGQKKGSIILYRYQDRPAFLSKAAPPALPSILTVSYTHLTLPTILLV